MTDIKHILQNYFFDTVHLCNWFWIEATTYKGFLRKILAVSRRRPQEVEGRIMVFFVWLVFLMLFVSSHRQWHLNWIRGSPKSRKIQGIPRVLQVLVSMAEWGTHHYSLNYFCYHFQKEFLEELFLCPEVLHVQLRYWRSVLRESLFNRDSGEKNK